MLVPFDRQLPILAWSPMWTNRVFVWDQPCSFRSPWYNRSILLKPSTTTFVKAIIALLRFENKNVIFATVFLPRWVLAQSFRCLGGVDAHAYMRPHGMTHSNQHFAWCLNQTTGKFSQARPVDPALDNFLTEMLTPRSVCGIQPCFHLQVYTVVLSAFTVALMSVWDV